MSGWRKAWRKNWVYLPLIFWALVVLFPMYWVVITSFKGSLAISQGPTYLPWLDFEPTLGPWREILMGSQSGPIRSALLNSVIVGFVSSFLALFLGSLAAYGLTRFEYKFGFLGNRDALLFIVSQRMMPPIVTALALFLMLRTVGLVDSRVGLILVYTAFNLPLVVWLMYNFFKQIPPYLEDAAIVDGANLYQVLWHVIIPVSLPGMIASFFFIFIFAWNEFLFALILTLNDARTLPIFIAAQHSQQGVQWGPLSAMSLLTIIPVILVTLGVQRFLVQKLLIGGAK